MKYILVVFCVAIALLSCSEDNDCFIADTIYPEKAVRIDGKDHFLYLRSSGFQDKVFFYEIYETAPAFDVCGKTAANPRYSLPIDDTDTGVDKLIITDDKIDIIYVKGGIKITDLENLEVVFIDR